MSLDLDSRQRAMLQEMGVRVWSPQALDEAPVLVDSVAPAPVLAPAVAAPRVMPAPQIAQTAPPAADRAPQPSASAIESSAVNAVNMRVKPLQAAKMVIATAATGTPNVLAEGIADMDWPALSDAIVNCQACQLCTDRRAPVFGGSEAEAPRRADWLVVGEPPDEVDERQGSPFADPSGQLLDNMLKAVGVSRRRATGEATQRDAAKAAYVTNVVKCRPATVRNPSAQELAVCEHFLRREVALVQPKVILAMGRFAAQTLLQGSLPEGSKQPFGKLRGQVYRYQGIPVVVTYHPTYLLRTQADKARAWADLCLALDVVRGGQ